MGECKTYMFGFGFLPNATSFNNPFEISTAQSTSNTPYWHHILLFATNSNVHHSRCLHFASGTSSMEMLFSAAHCYLQYLLFSRASALALVQSPAALY